MYRIMSLVGLGGTRRSHTSGDFWWCVGMAWVSGFLMGVAVVAVVLRYGWM